MKAILVFCLLLAVSFAAPQEQTHWTDCRPANATSSILTHNVTLIREAESKFNISFCGQARENLQIREHWINVFIDDAEYSLEGEKASRGERVLNAGQNFCYDLSYLSFYVDFPADYTFQVKLRNARDQLHCFNVTLTVPETQTRKRLSYYINQIK